MDLSEDGKEVGTADPFLKKEENSSARQRTRILLRKTRRDWHMDYMDSVKIDLCEHWKFHLGEKEEAWYKGFDDSGWEEVTLPHDWSVGLPFSESNSSGTGYLSGGIGWYRVRFSLPEEYRGKRYCCCLTGL